MFSMLTGNLTVTALKWGAVAIFVIAVLWYVRDSGRQSVIDDLKDDRIQILKQRGETDVQTDQMSKEELCKQLGGSDADCVFD